MKTLAQQLQTDLVNPTLVSVLEVVAHACQRIASRLQRGALAGVLGSSNTCNVQGETQQKLDIIANDLLTTALSNTTAVRALASEEETSMVVCHNAGQYLVAFDPLDGSSNIDINSLVGSIFSIYPAPHTEVVSEQDFLQPGKQQVAAAYVLYGPSVMLALTLGDGVQLYTLDPQIGEFVLTTPKVVIPADTCEFAINMSNQRFWAPPMQAYIRDLLAGSDGPRGKNFNMRWVAAMVADVHRILCRGGIFAYPWDKRDPDKPGKLRLMYEANPMSFLVEQAGGQAYSDTQRILGIQPEHIHQRVPVVLGSANEIEHYVGYE